MSLINEALRKARAEAAEREGRRYGVPRALVLPPKRSQRGFRAALLVVAIVAAAVGGAALTWWVFGRRPAADRAASATATSVKPVPGAIAAATPTPPPAPVAAAAPVPTRAARPSATTTPSPAAAAPLAGGSEGAPATSPGPTAAPPQRALPPIRDASASAARPPTVPAAEAREGAPDSSRPVEARETPRSAGGGRERSFVIDADLGHVKLHLDFVVYRPGSPFASINGGQVVIGSVIEGLTVEEIGPDFVRLRDRHGAVVLRVR